MVGRWRAHPSGSAAGRRLSSLAYRDADPADDRPSGRRAPGGRYRFSAVFLTVGRGVGADSPVSHRFFCGPRGVDNQALLLEGTLRRTPTNPVCLERQPGWRPDEEPPRHEGSDDRLRVRVGEARSLRDRPCGERSPGAQDRGKHELLSAGEPEPKKRRKQDLGTEIGPLYRRAQ